MPSTNPARGMRDFLPSDVRKREYVIGVIKQVYEFYGFEPLETPAVENIDTLMGKYGEEGNQLIFKVLKRGEKLGESIESIIQAASLESKIYDATLEGKLSPRLVNPVADLALRYDLTVPLARVVANNRDKLPKFFKRYQIQPVWRADRPARGRFREFYQCDVDCIGSSSVVVEAEIVSAACEILVRLGFQEFVVRLNHRKLLSGILTSQQVGRAQNAALIALDKLDKIGHDGVRKELEQVGLSGDTAAKLLHLFGQKQAATSNFGKKFYEAALSAISKSELSKLRDDDQIKESVAELETLSGLLDDRMRNRVQIDPSLARGLSYYTGTIMEINVDGIGSLGGGGRYDGLIGMFGKEQIPACGFSLGLERILVVMEERGMFPPEIADSTPADVLVTIWSGETVADSLKLANQLRAGGLRVTLYPQADKEDKQWKYANTIGVPWICTVNADDIAEGMVSFQSLRTRERFREKMEQVAAKIEIA